MSGSPATLRSAAATPEPPEVDEKTPLYQSLVAAIEMRNTANNEWLKKVADFDNNPRLIHERPYDDNALHWVNKEGHVIPIAFPATLDIHGHYSRLGPYFNMEQGPKVSTLTYQKFFSPFNP